MPNVVQSHLLTSSLDAQLPIEIGIETCKLRWLIKDLWWSIRENSCSQALVLTWSSIIIIILIGLGIGGFHSKVLIKTFPNLASRTLLLISFHLVFLWHLFSIDRKRVTKNSKSTFQIHEITKSFFDCVGNFSNPHVTGASSSSFRGGGAIFMNVHSMTLSCLFNRGTTSSQTVTDCYFRNISENENLLVLIKPVARGAKSTLRFLSPPWKNVLDIV